jgi:hypothetical protein
MRKRTTLTAVVLGALAVAGAGTGLAASGGSCSSGFLDSLAKHLGVSREKLDEATKAAAKDQVDEALAEGKITKEQADEAKKRIDSGEGRLFGFGRGPGFGHRGAPGGHLEDAASYLGLTLDQLVTQLRSGKSLADVAKAEGKSVDGLKKALVESEKKELDAAVAAGRLTEAQAKEILARKTEHLDDMINGTLEGPGMHPRGFGFGPPRNRDHDDAEPAALGEPA